MKKKINIHYMIIASVTIILTLVLVTAVFYELFKKEIMNNLKIYAHVLQCDLDNVSMNSFDSLPKDERIRITLMDMDGTVTFDNQVDIEKMSNHKKRPEIVKARENGEGQAVRMSSTVEKSNFYYALRVGDNQILRLAKETSSIWSVFFQAIPVIVLIGVILILLCAVLAHFLTKSLVKPIEIMANDMEEIKPLNTYRELAPFVTMIQKQHLDILRNAKMRQEFTANVSHELKTPLTSISGYSELIANGMASPGDIKRFAQEIHRNAKRLLVLINDIIRLSQLDSTEVDITFEQVDLYQIAENCKNMLQLNAKNHEVSISLSGQPMSVYANRQMMEELVYNLCDNAIRYNNKGGKVLMELKETENEQMFSVKDDGIGISKEHQKRIFERFYRVDKSRSKSTGGTGLGLAIVKHIVAQHGADIKIDSEENKGTKISIYFKKEME